MKILQLGVLGVCVWLSSERDVQASEQITVDFEGLSNSGEFVLTNQVSGVIFENVVVMTPATVRCSVGGDLSAATSGSSAASSFGAKVRFKRPVVGVSMNVSSSFVTVPVNKVAGYFTAYLKAYDQGNKLITSATAPVISRVAEPEHIRNVAPAAISVSASIPISYVTIDFDEPWSSDGRRLLFDDLVMTVVEQVPPVRPTLQIERRSKERIVVSWNFPSSQLEQSTNLISWETIPTQIPGSYDFYMTSTSGVFFRVRR